MRKSFFAGSTLFLYLFFSTGNEVNAQYLDAMIRISEDPIARDYKILFSSAEKLPVSVTLFSSEGSTILFSDDQGTIQNFVKKYSLLDAPLGKYKWEIKYGNKSYSEEFEIMSEKRLIKESISAELDNLLNLRISVEKYNKLPVSIFLYEGKKQLDFIFWEPTLDERIKIINLGNYDAYEIRLEILQKGDVAFEEQYRTY
ncbi:MAG: hypothetical protein ACO2ZZ_08480 [Cyclobacteriaceae bacterium]